MTLRTAAALLLAVALTASAVLAAGPAHSPAPRTFRDEAPAARELKFSGWLTLVKAEGDSEAVLRVVTLNGSFEVLVASETVLRRAADGAKLRPGDLAAGLPVDVQGSLSEDAAVRAAVVAVGSLPDTTATERLTLRGRILASFAPTAVTSQRQLLVMTSARGEAVLEVDANTDIRTDAGKSFGFGDLRAGQSVLVEAYGTTQAVARAAAIEVSQSGRAPQVTVDGVLLARGSLSKGAERWLVGDVLIRVPADLASVNGVVALSTQVSVTAQRSLDDGELQALRIRAVAKAARPQLVNVRGRVEKWDGNSLLVDGTLLSVKAGLAAPDGLAEGVFVKVKAIMDGSGRLEAQSIEIMAPGRVEVQFEGPIDEIGGNEWKVAGVTVRIAGDTKISGDKPGVASHAEVSGAQDSNAVVHASSIRVTSSLTPSSLPLEGRLIEAPPRPNVWKVQGRDMLVVAVLVSDTTIIDESSGPAAVGRWVQVRGARNGSDQVVAERIRVR